MAMLRNLFQMFVYFFQPVEAAGVSFARPYLLDDNEIKPDPETLEMLIKYQVII